MSFYCNGRKGVCPNPDDCTHDCEYYDGSCGEHFTSNGDRIRAMDDEDLAWVLMDFRIDAFAQSSGNQNALPNTQEKICEWLQQPVEVEDDL